jgi:hypothetical protein
MTGPRELLGQRQSGAAESGRLRRSGRGHRESGGHRVSRGKTLRGGWPGGCAEQAASQRRRLWSSVK